MKSITTKLKGAFKSILTITIAASLTSIASAQQADKKPVKIYLMVGQSNMQGYGHVEADKKNPKPNTLRHVVENDPKKEFQYLVNKDGSWKEREDVWIHLEYQPGNEQFSGLKPNYGARKGFIGPELSFGNIIGDANEGKVLIIKTTWGGKSLGQNFLPPSIGKYPTPAKNSHPGYYYHRILKIVENVTENMNKYFPDYDGQGIEIAGLCWHQGWNDQYSGLDAKYEENMVAFINDIRSEKHGLGVPNLPIVIATSGMITKDSLIKTSQKAMADHTKYPLFKGNVAVVDTDKPYGADKLQFFYEAKDSPRNQGFHWNGNARTHLHIGSAMAAEMKKLEQPTSPSRLVAYGTSKGVQLTWQIGSEQPNKLDLLRNGKSLGVKFSGSETTYLDETALPGANQYELALTMPTSTLKLTTKSDTSVTDLKAFRSTNGVTLSWQAKGKYTGFTLSRDGKVINDNISPDTRIYEDKTATQAKQINYTIQPKTGKVTAAKTTINLGTIDPGEALVYEPFDYPADADKPQSLVGKKGAPGTKGAYYSLGKEKPGRAPQTIAGGLSYGDLPVTGNKGTVPKWSKGCAIELDDSLKKAGLLDDGATLWISYISNSEGHGGAAVTLQSADSKEGIGFRVNNRERQTVVIIDGKLSDTRIGGYSHNTPSLAVGKFVWGKNGENDTFDQMGPRSKLEPREFGRPFKKFPFNIDQTKLSRLVFSHGNEGSSFDEIRIGATYESVVGGKK
jgi:hypothetical protein